jgi:hypothetical protein
MRARRIPACTLAVLLVVQSTACSMMTLKPLPENYRPSQPPDCGSSWGLIPDTLFAAYSVAGLATLFLIGGGWHSSPGSDMGPLEAINPASPGFGLTLLFLAVSALFVGSTTTGLIWAKRCREATDSHEAWLEMERLRGAVEEEVR